MPVIVDDTKYTYANVLQHPNFLSRPVFLVLLLRGADCFNPDLKSESVRGAPCLSPSGKAMSLEKLAARSLAGGYLAIPGYLVVGVV